MPPRLGGRSPQVPASPAPRGRITLCAVGVVCGVGAGAAGVYLRCAIATRLVDAADITADAAVAGLLLVAAVHAVEALLVYACAMALSTAALGWRGRAVNGVFRRALKAAGARRRQQLQQQRERTGSTTPTAVCFHPPVSDPSPLLSVQRVVGHSSSVARDDGATAVAWALWGLGVVAGCPGAVGVDVAGRGETGSPHCTPWAGVIPLLVGAGFLVVPSASVCVCSRLPPDIPRPTPPGSPYEGDDGVHGTTSAIACPWLTALARHQRAILVHAWDRGALRWARKGFAAAVAVSRAGVGVGVWVWGGVVAPALWGAAALGVPLIYSHGARGGAMAPVHVGPGVAMSDATGAGGVCSPRDGDTTALPHRLIASVGRTDATSAPVPLCLLAVLPALQLAVYSLPVGAAALLQFTALLRSEWRLGPQWGPAGAVGSPSLQQSEPVDEGPPIVIDGVVVAGPVLAMPNGAGAGDAGRTRRGGEEGNDDDASDGNVNADSLHTPPPPPSPRMPPVGLRIPHFTAAPGTRVAVVSETPAGRSMFLACLLGRHPHAHGDVQVTSDIGYAPSQPWVRTATVRENIVMGRGRAGHGAKSSTTPDDGAAEDRLRECLAACGLDAYVATLPDGVDTVVGGGGAQHEDDGDGADGVLELAALHAMAEGGDCRSRVCEAADEGVAGGGPVSARSSSPSHPIRLAPGAAARMTLARAIYTRPRLLILDDPSAFVLPPPRASPPPTGVGGGREGTGAAATDTAAGPPHPEALWEAIHAYLTPAQSEQAGPTPTGDETTSLAAGADSPSFADEHERMLPASAAAPASEAGVEQHGCGGDARATTTIAALSDSRLWHACDRVVMVDDRRGVVADGAFDELLRGHPEFLALAARQGRAKCWVDGDNLTDTPEGTLFNRSRREGDSCDVPSDEQVRGTEGDGHMEGEDATGERGDGGIDVDMDIHIHDKAGYTGRAADDGDDAAATARQHSDVHQDSRANISRCGHGGVRRSGNSTADVVEALTRGAAADPRSLARRDRRAAPPSEVARDPATPGNVARIPRRGLKHAVLGLGCAAACGHALLCVGIGGLAMPEHTPVSPVPLPGQPGAARLVPALIVMGCVACVSCLSAAHFRDDAAIRQHDITKFAAAAHRMLYRGMGGFDGLDATSYRTPAPRANHNIPPTARTAEATGRGPTAAANAEGATSQEAPMRPHCGSGATAPTDRIFTSPPLSRPAPPSHASAVWLGIACGMVVHVLAVAVMELRRSSVDAAEATWWAWATQATTFVVVTSVVGLSRVVAKLTYETVVRAVPCGHHGMEDALNSILAAFHDAALGEGAGVVRVMNLDAWAMADFAARVDRYLELLRHRVRARARQQAAVQVASAGGAMTLVAAAAIACRHLAGAGEGGDASRLRRIAAVVILCGANVPVLLARGLHGWGWMRREDKWPMDEGRCRPRTDIPYTASRASRSGVDEEGGEEVRHDAHGASAFIFSDVSWSGRPCGATVDTEAANDADASGRPHTSSRICAVDHPHAEPASACLGPPLFNVSFHVNRGQRIAIVVLGSPVSPHHNAAGARAQVLSSIGAVLSGLARPTAGAVRVVVGDATSTPPGSDGSTTATPSSTTCTVTAAAVAAHQVPTPSSAPPLPVQAGGSVRAASPATLRRLVAYLPGVPAWINGASVRVNMDPFSEYTEGEVEAALERVGAMALLREEAGVGGAGMLWDMRLPSGAWAARQAVGIARAALRGMRCVVVEEPLGLMNPAAELALSLVLDHCRTHLAVVVLARRLNTVLHSDAVVVVAAGRVVETGAPATLLDDPYTLLHRHMQYGARPNEASMGWDSRSTLSSMGGFEGEEGRVDVGGHDWNHDHESPTFE